MYKIGRMHPRLTACAGIRQLCLMVPLAFTALVRPLPAAPPSGEAVFGERCASCHDSGDPRIPRRDDLKKLTVTTITRTLDFGLMASIASPLRRDERDAVAAFLGIPGGNATPPAKAFCADRSVKIDDHAKAVWNGWSPSLTNTRYQPADQAGLSIAQVPASSSSGRTAMTATSSRFHHQLFWAINCSSAAQGA